LLLPLVPGCDYHNHLFWPKDQFVVASWLCSLRLIFLVGWENVVII
jgi:hypothetical protein